MVDRGRFFYNCKTFVVQPAIGTAYPLPIIGQGTLPMRRWLGLGDERRSKQSEARDVARRSAARNRARVPYLPAVGPSRIAGQRIYLHNMFSKT
jgi:hypothetical protein